MVAISRASFFNALIASSATLSFINNHPQQTPDKNEYYTASANYVRKEITHIIKNQDPSLAGSILRLAFHDATVRSVASDPFVGGADGSIRYELDWSENRGLAKPLKVVQQVFESQQRKYCPFDDSDPVSALGTDVSTGLCHSLSFADVLALSGAAAVEAAQGPNIRIRLGRKDAHHADNRFLDNSIQGETDRSSITSSLPSAALDSLGLRNYFTRLGLSESEMVALSGAHDLGRHVTLTGMPRECLRNLTRVCLEDAPVLAPFITADPDTLSNRYFQTMLRWNDRNIEFGEAAFIPTDVAMVVDGGLKKHVIVFANDEQLFFRRFSSAYQKLVDSTATSSSRY